MLRFAVTVIAGAMFYTAATFVDMVLAPGDDNLAAFTTPILAVIFTTVVVTFLLLPVRALLRRFLPGASQRAHAIFAATALIVLVTGLTFAGSHSRSWSERFGFRATWALYALTITFALFWPLAKARKAARN